jgi:hypothetical protein
VNGYSVDGRPWYVAFQVNDLFLTGEINYDFLAVYSFWFFSQSTPTCNSCFLAYIPS